MFFQTDPVKQKEKVAKRKAKAAHQKRGKSLDKARKRADAEYNKVDPEIAEWNRINRKAFLRRKKKKERAQRKFDKQKMGETAKIFTVISVVIIALYYGMTIHAWFSAPIYMALGWGLEKVMQFGKKAKGHCI